jgi:hypothetical protein
LGYYKRGRVSTPRREERLKTQANAGFSPHEAGQIAVGAAWWLCGSAVCDVAASFFSESESEREKEREVVFVCLCQEEKLR